MPATADSGKDMGFYLKTNQSAWLNSRILDHFTSMTFGLKVTMASNQLVTSTFDSPRRDEQAVADQEFQIHNFRGGHWACSYMADGMVHVADSLVNLQDDLCPFYKQQIVNLWLSESRSPSCNKFIIRRDAVFWW